MVYTRAAGHGQLAILSVGDRYPSGSGSARRRTLLDAGYFVKDLSHNEVVKKYPQLLDGPGVLNFDRLIMEKARQNHFDWVRVDCRLAVFPSTGKSQAEANACSGSQTNPERARQMRQQESELTCR